MEVETQQISLSKDSPLQDRIDHAKKLVGLGVTKHKACEICHVNWRTLVKYLSQAESGEQEGAA